jgi:hypothetical protein
VGESSLINLISIVIYIIPSGSTWGATFRSARQAYTAVTRSAIAYGAATWHTPSDNPAVPKGIASKLGTVQNKGLRAVAGTYRATPIRRVEVETFVPPIHIYLDSLVARAQERMKTTGAIELIHRMCQETREVLLRRRKRGRARNSFLEPRHARRA